VYATLSHVSLPNTHCSPVLFDTVTVVVTAAVVEATVVATVVAVEATVAVDGVSTRVDIAFSPLSSSFPPTHPLHPFVVLDLDHSGIDAL
jgi:hypothetical protein